MEIEALFWLKSSSDWLFYLFGKLWGSIAFNNFEVKINIRVKWNLFSTKWCYSVCTSPDVVRWTFKFGFITLLKLCYSQIPTFENFWWTKCKCFWKTISFLSWISNKSTTCKISLPMNCCPFSYFAIIYLYHFMWIFFILNFALSLCIDINSN